MNTNIFKLSRQYVHISCIFLLFVVVVYVRMLDPIPGGDAREVFEKNIGFKLFYEEQLPLFQWLFWYLSQWFGESLFLLIAFKYVLLFGTCVLTYFTVFNTTRSSQRALLGVCLLLSNMVFFYRMQSGGFYHTVLCMFFVFMTVYVIMCVPKGRFFVVVLSLTIALGLMSKFTFWALIPGLLFFNPQDKRQQTMLAVLIGVMLVAPYYLAYMWNPVGDTLEVYSRFSPNIHSFFLLNHYFWYGTLILLLNFLIFLWVVRGKKITKFSLSQNNLFLISVLSFLIGSFVMMICKGQLHWVVPFMSLFSLSIVFFAVDIDSTRLKALCVLSVVCFLYPNVTGAISYNVNLNQSVEEPLAYFKDEISKRYGNSWCVEYEPTFDNAFLAGFNKCYVGSVNQKKLFLSLDRTYADPRVRRYAEEKFGVDLLQVRPNFYELQRIDKMRYLFFNVRRKIRIKVLELP